ncbi:MAG TPA: beta-ketoacyl synthase N-terminal-like domain-containing protein [Acidobacteriaceae bacterium]|jgi:3-oxoacyl-(acyl-carrier-protein) synthase|nr:beta-ketoacyl synthase N-terminal-like domain-containing protein [Acidobacteriaceae bacterium]
MKPTILPAITGIGSVSPFGPLAGLIPHSHVEPTPITAWATDGLRRAFLVTPFQPSSIVPGVKTRRLDRLSAWAVVASSLALQDAGIDLDLLDRSRVAVVFGTGSGCIESAESFFQSAHVNGWSGTDPITFPETLANSPAGHVAIWHNVRGPNITVSVKNFSGESAMLQAASLLRHGQADLAIVIAGDTVTRTFYEWYETAGLLAPACFNSGPLLQNSGYVPSEGVVALVLEPEGSRPAGSRNARSYAHLKGGHWTAGGEPVAGIRKVLGGEIPDLAICAGDGAPCTAGSTACSPTSIVGPDATIVPAQTVALGLTDAGGLLHLVLALSERPKSGQALMMATPDHSGFAALLLDIP